MSRRIRSRAVVLPASCARKSSATASGLREARRYASSMSRRISFPSTILIGGRQMPSSKAFSAEPQKEEGVLPPMSYWCRQFVTQQNSSPFQNTGQMSITSCWCAAPTHGSLARNMSPSRIPGLSLRYSRIHFTWVSVTPDMYCMYGPKYTNSPSSVRIEGLRSSAYIATGEPEMRWIVAPCSSFTCQSEWRTTS